MTAIHQFVAGFSNGDAISNEARVLRGIFRSWGFASDIFCEARRILPELRREAADVASCAASLAPGDIVLLHLSIGSPVNDAFAALRCRKAILYHNITPPEYFALVNPQTAANLARGRDQLRALAGAAQVVMADSGYNAGELRAAGYGDVGVLPLVLDFDSYGGACDGAALKRFGDGRVNVIFVGRCVPNKRFEDLLAAFACFQRGVEADSRLVLAGSYAGTERYQSLMVALARDLGLRDVCFLGAVRQAELNAVYRRAHVFLSMSEHEGFCIPLVESMVHGVPVLAFAAAAVPETLGGAGVLFRAKRFDWVAEMMGRLACDSALRAAVKAGQDRRLAAYRARRPDEELRRFMAPLLGG